MGIEIVDWDYWGKRLQERFRREPPGMALSYHFTIEINLDEEYVFHDRLGYLTCSRPCVDGTITDMGNHNVTLQEMREVSVRLGHSISKSIQTGTKSSLSEKLKTPISEVGAAIESSLNFSRTSVDSVELAIREASTRTQTLSLSHGPDCRTLQVPWGVVAVLTLRGPFSIRRYYRLGPKFSIIWEDKFVLDFSQVEVDFSVDYDLFYEDKIITVLDCSECEHGATDSVPGSSESGGSEGPKEERREDGRHHSVPRSEFKQQESRSELRNTAKEVGAVLFRLQPDDDMPKTMSEKPVKPKEITLPGKSIQANKIAGLEIIKRTKPPRRK